MSDYCLRISLYQPDIPQNTGAMMRVCACLGMGLDLIEPFGFPWKPELFKRSGMDYVDLVHFQKHSSWGAYTEKLGDNNRLILMTTKTDQSYTSFKFRKGDILLAGRESSGVPQEVHDFCEHRVTIPMHGTARSMNIVNATSIIAAEALRQMEQL